MLDICQKTWLLQKSSISSWPTNSTLLEEASKAPISFQRGLGLLRLFQELTWSNSGVSRGFIPEINSSFRFLDHSEGAFVFSRPNIKLNFEQFSSDIEQKFDDHEKMSRLVQLCLLFRQQPDYMLLFIVKSVFIMQPVNISYILNGKRRKVYLKWKTCWVLLCLKIRNNFGSDSLKLVCRT